MEQAIATVTSSTRPASPNEGQVLYETDTDRLYIYDGTAWRTLGGSKWNSYTPTWTNLTVGNGTQSAIYRYIDGGIWVKGVLTFGTTTSISGTVTQTIPNSETSKSTGFNVGACGILDSGTQNYAGMTHVTASSTSISFFHGETGNTGAVNATTPMTWTTSDQLRWDIQIALD
jgi:hypothetical protein